MIFKLIKFCIVGGVGMILDFSITYLLKDKVKINRYAANATGFASAATLNYIFNRMWTFSSTNPNLTSEYMVFIFFATIGLFINTSFLYVFERKLKYNFYVAKFLAIVVTTLWNFSTSYLFTFKP